MSETESQLLCKSIFKDGKTTTSKDKFTGAWINLINQLEKNKNISVRQKAKLIPNINNSKAGGKNK